jgi:hypothetical protein
VIYAPQAGVVYAFPMKKYSILWIALTISILAITACSIPTPFETTADPTFTPQLTALPTETLTSPSILKIDISLLALVDREANSIYLQDIATGTLKELHYSDETRLFDINKWSHDGCSLFLTIFTSPTEWRIVRSDLQGHLIATVFDSENYQREGHITALRVSPDERYFSFQANQGDYLGGYDPIYEFMDLEIVELEDGSLPVRVSTNGGVWNSEWSPDGAHIAYTDYDESGIMQLFIADVQGQQRRQITNNADPSKEFATIGWSNDSARIAYSLQTIELTGNVKDVEIVLHSYPNNNPQVVVRDQFLNVPSIWWTPEGNVAAYGIVPPDTAHDAIMWIEARSGEILDVLYGGNAPHGHMLMPRPVDTADTIGFFTETHESQDIFVYDRLSDEFQHVFTFDPRINVDNWKIAPIGFQSIAACVDAPDS